MAQLVRLRIELADTPGSLATVAAVIAGQGGNITAVDVHSGQPSTVVDEIVVDFPDDTNMGDVREAIATSGAATLLSHHSAERADPVIQTLRRTASLLRSPLSSPDAELAAAVAELCSTPSVWVCDGVQARSYDAGRFALENDGAVTLKSADVPEQLRATLPNGEAWLLAIPDVGLNGHGRVVFVARPLDLEFTATEIARIEALTAMYDELVRLRSSAPAGI